MDHRMIRGMLAERLAGFRQTDLPVELYPHQDETLDKMQAWLANPNGARRAYVAHATGLGKTILFASLLRFCAGMRALVVVSTKTLVDQTVRTLAKFTSGRLVHMSSLPNILDDDDNVLARRWKDQDFDVLVTTDESFKTKRGCERLKAFNPHLVVWDECHWAYTEKAQTALAPFPEAVVLAFSATPDFLTNVCKNDYAPVTLDNGQVLYGTPDRFARTHFGDLLDERGARWGIENGYLAPLAWGRLEFSFSLDSIPTVNGPGGMDYDQSALSKMLAKNWPFVSETICKLYQSGQYGLAGRFAAAICPGVKQAHEITEALNSIGVPSACITASTSDVDRRRIFQAGEAGELAFLGSVFALREGWDSPRAEVAMMLRPTKSRVLYMQFMGRVLRKLGDKIALVLDPHYQNSRFAPLSAPVLFGRPGQEVREGDILVGPKTGGKTRKVVPPWLKGEKLGLLQPTLVVEKIDIEYWAGKEGTFEADGETWGTHPAIASILALSIPTIRSRSKDCRSRSGKLPHGRCHTFYALSDVRTACAALLENLPQAGLDGMFEADGETWGTQNAIANALGLSVPTIKSRSEGCRNRPGKSSFGARYMFYALSDAQAACADLLGGLPQAGPDGMFEADGEMWGTLKAIARVLGISASTITDNSPGCRNRPGKTASGGRHIFYALTDVRAACADLLLGLPQAGPDGTFEADGEIWGTLSTIAKILGVSTSPVTVKSEGCRSRLGKIVSGACYRFYALTDVRAACADLLGDLPQAGPDGMFEADGEMWGTKWSIANLLGVSHWSISDIDAASKNLKIRPGKSTNGRRYMFYAISDIKKVWADLQKSKQ